MAAISSRNPTKAEEAAVALVLRELREHFHEWPTSEGHEHHLVAFAYYEGCGGSACCGQLLAEAAPLALGGDRVPNHGFRWVMLISGESRRYGVVHPALSGPIDLAS